jgi:hypothetical protein
MRHLIRFYSGEGKPTLLFRGGNRDSHDCAPLPAGKAGGEGSNEPGKLELTGEQGISFSEQLACIGYRAPDGFRACPNSAIHMRQCPTCSALDLARAYTKGDFSGYPALYEEAKKEEYALYLAAFGEKIIKCGVTRKERFEMRMREQGADFGCIVATFTGPDEIYHAEAELQSRFMLSNAVRISQKMRMLDFDRQSARENLASTVELVRNSGAVPDFAPSILDFSEFYPRARHAKETHAITGEILGAKGEILLFRSGLGGNFAINMRKQVGSFF